MPTVVAAPLPSFIMSHTLILFWGTRPVYSPLNLSRIKHHLRPKGHLALLELPIPSAAALSGLAQEGVAISHDYKVRSLRIVHRWSFYLASYGASQLKAAKGPRIGYKVLRSGSVYNPSKPLLLSGSIVAIHMCALAPGLSAEMAPGSG